MHTIWKTGAAVLALPLAVALATGCGVSKKDYKAAQDNIAALTSEKQELQSNLDAANAKNAQLGKEVAGMQSSVAELNADLERQKQENAEAHSAYEGMVSQLKEEVNSGQIEVQQMRDGIRVNMAQDILFKSGSASLDANGKAVLGKVADQVKGSSYQVVVIGHTDNQKLGAALAQRYGTNWELGAARAGTIVRVFQDAGIEPSRLLAVSAGEYRPRADNSTPEGRDQNRRIEIRLRPIEIDESVSK
jgi:chemotaxis protein MotB